MSAKAADKLFPQQRTFQDRQLRTKTLKTLKFSYGTFEPIISFTYI